MYNSEKLEKTLVYAQENHELFDKFKWNTTQQRKRTTQKVTCQHKDQEEKEQFVAG